MARIGTRTATIAAAAGGLCTAFFALSPTAAADPAPAPATPGMPGIDLMQQLGNAPAMASQFLQSAASMLQPKPAATASHPGRNPAADHTAPSASASLTLPQQPAAPLSAPMNSLVGTVPQGQLNLPASVPVAPLLSQLGLPGNLSGLPIPNLGTNPVASDPGAQPASPRCRRTSTRSPRFLDATRCAPAERRTGGRAVLR